VPGEVRGSGACNTGAATFVLRMGFRKAKGVLRRPGFRVPDGGVGWMTLIKRVVSAG
jgi:hypothetical protein